MLYTVSLTGSVNDDSIIEDLGDIMDDFRSAVENLEILNNDLEDTVSEISERLDSIDDKIRDLCKAIYSNTSNECKDSNIT